MIHFMRNVLTILTVISSSNAAPPKPYSYSDFPRCKRYMTEMFGKPIAKKTPLECFKTAVEKISIIYGVDPDVLEYAKSFIGRVDTTNIKLPPTFCVDEVKDMFRNSETTIVNILDVIDEAKEECRKAIMKFGRSINDVMTNALTMHKIVIATAPECEFLHKPNSFGAKYLDHIRNNVTSLIPDKNGDLPVTPLLYCQRAHNYVPKETDEKEKVPPTEPEPKTKIMPIASTSGSTKKLKRRNKS